MYQRILLAYDGSLEGREALAQAENLALATGATVHLLAVIDPAEGMAIAEGIVFAAGDRRFVAQSVLGVGLMRLQSVGCTTTSDIKYGNPAVQIELSAREMNADLIVVGHRDQGTLARWLNGSVEASILHHPPCSVLVVVKSKRVANNVVSIQKLKARGKG